MKIKQATDNGNVEGSYNYGVIPNILINQENISWRPVSNFVSRDLDFSTGRVDNIAYATEIISSNINTPENSQTNDISQIRKVETLCNINANEVCNRQYKLNANINIFDSRNKSESPNLEGATEFFVPPREILQGNSYDSPQVSPNDDERAFEQSDTDDISDNGSHPVPRGIVNPNYPGFQHLAHTLQDYSSNIENFYHSENEMTDDDIEIGDVYVEPETKNYNTNINNNINNNNNGIEDSKSFYFSYGNVNEIHIPLNNRTKDIPDLLKTVSITQERPSICFNTNCTEKDIENNFNTSDIIGDFNKEIEDEIKQVLNYNIKIQDDLEELKKDIKDNFTKPIEETLQNISEVVNHVIKKLVQNNTNEEPKHISNTCYFGGKVVEEENKRNALKEMHLSRPTFLLLEKSIDNKITDAFLSDGKDEIIISDDKYDTETLPNNVENTIKQLSTELKKIIPKLDELREREKLFAPTRHSSPAITRDDNCNKIASSSKSVENIVPIDESVIELIGKRRTPNESQPHNTTNKLGLKSINDSRVSRETRSGFSPSSSCSKSAHDNSSVRNTETKEDYDLGCFDVYNIETALPKLDLDAIESHLRAAKEAERRKRNDREEIRKRLALGAENEEYYSMGHIDRPGKKPSLQSRLQSGKNLQICFMNETASDNESQTSDAERNLNQSNKNLSRSSIFSKSNYSLNNHPYQTRPLSVNISKHDKISTVQSAAKLRPTSLSVKTSKSRSSQSLTHIELKESDFYALQATLQTEARIALAQAKEMARIQMERERRTRAVSPVTEMLRRSMQKASAPLAADRRRVSRHLLTDMNVAQLQVIVNELHCQIESLNESLVQLLMARDDLHMGQDSMLVDIEDLTRYLGVKEQTKKTKGSSKGVRRLASLVHK